MTDAGSAAPPSAELTRRARRRLRRDAGDQPAAEQLLQPRSHPARSQTPATSWPPADAAAPSCCAAPARSSARAPTSPPAHAIGTPDGTHLYDFAIRLFEQPLPIVAAIQGAAIGGGLGLAMAADFRVAAPEARFAANFALIGIHQGFALSVTLPAVVGQQAALDLLYTGRRVSGAEARALGPGRSARRAGPGTGRGTRPRGADRRIGSAGGPLHPGHDARRARRAGTGSHGA